MGYPAKRSLPRTAHALSGGKIAPRGGEQSGIAAGAASGGGLFTAEKSPKRAGGCGPRSPLRLRGVHPKERHFLAVTLHRVIPFHTAFPFPASHGPVESDNRTATEVFSKAARTATERGGMPHTAVFTRMLPIHRRDAHRASGPRSSLSWWYNSCGAPQVMPALVGADAYIGPYCVSGLSLKAHGLRKASYTAAPLKAPLCKGAGSRSETGGLQLIGAAGADPLRRFAPPPLGHQGEAWAGTFGAGAPASYPGGHTGRPYGGIAACFGCCGRFARQQCKTAAEQALARSAAAL